MNIKSNYLELIEGTIIILFILLSLLKLIYSLFYVNERAMLIGVRVISVFIYIFLGYFTYKDRLVPSIVMLIILLITGLGGIAEGILLGEMILTLRITMIVGGSLFVCGAITIIYSLKIKTNPFGQSGNGHR